VTTHDRSYDTYILCISQFVKKNYAEQQFSMTDDDLVSKFRILVDYLLDKFK